MNFPHNNININVNNPMFRWPPENTVVPISKNLDCDSINTFCLSNLSCFFMGGRFNNFIDNSYGYRAKRYNVLNVCKVNRIQPAMFALEDDYSSGIGSGLGKVEEFVYGLTLSGDKLIAVGNFTMGNTVLTGFQALRDIDFINDSIFKLSGYNSCFAQHIYTGDCIPITAFHLLFDEQKIPDIYPFVAGLSTSFYPIVTGDGNIKYYAYYDFNIHKWFPFHNSSIDFNSLPYTAYDLISATYPIETLFCVLTTPDGTLYTGGMAGVAGNFGDTNNGGAVYRYKDNSWSALAGISGGYIQRTEEDPNNPGEFIIDESRFEIRSLAYDSRGPWLYIGGKYYALNGYWVNTGLVRYDIATDTYLSLGDFYPWEERFSGVDPDTTPFMQLSDLDIDYALVNSIVLSGDMVVCIGYGGINVYDYQVDDWNFADFHNEQLPRDVPYNYLTQTSSFMLVGELFMWDTLSGSNYYPTVVVGGHFYNPLLDFLSDSVAYNNNMAVIDTSEGILNLNNIGMFNTQTTLSGSDRPVVALCDFSQSFYTYPSGAQDNIPYAYFDDAGIYYTTHLSSASVIFTPCALLKGEGLKDTPGTGIVFYDTAPYFGLSGITVI